MNRLSLAEYRSRAAGHAAAVAATPGIDAFCSGPLWQLAAHDHLHESGATGHLLLERDGAWLVGAELDQPHILFPLEAAWMFGCPLAGDPHAATALVRDAIAAGKPDDGPLAIVLSGLVRDGAMHQALRTLHTTRRGLREHPGSDVMLIDLADGLEAWLGRRSKKFRRTLRAAEAEIPGLEIVDASREDPESLFDRLLAIQRGSYKWREGTDIFQMPGYAAFYRALLEGLHAADGLRLLFARRDGVDLAHIFGGVCGTTYRGLQMSYLEEARDLGLGNRLQLENLRLRAAEGVATYDLGMVAPYKERWADLREERVVLFWIGR